MEGMLVGGLIVNFPMLIVISALLGVSLAMLHVKKSGEELRNEAAKLIVGVSLIVVSLFSYGKFENIKWFAILLNLMLVIGILLLLWVYVGVFVKKETKLEILGNIAKVLVIIGVITALASFIPSFSYFSGDTETAIRTADIVSSILVIVMVLLSGFGLISLFGEAGESKTGEEGKEGGKERSKSGKSEIKYKNPFRELLNEINKVLIFLLIIPLLFSTSIVRVIPEPGWNDYSIHVLPTNVNYTYNVTGDIIYIELNYPPNVTTATLDILIIYPEKTVHKTYTVTDGSFPVYDLRPSQEVSLGVKGLFSAVGLYNFWLPMFLVFLLSYALLKKILPSNVGKDILILIAMTISVLFGYSSWATKFVSSYVPYIGAGLVGIVGVGLLLVTIFPKGLEDIKSNPYLMGFLVWVALSFIFLGIYHTADTLSNGKLSQYMMYEVSPGLPVGTLAIFGWFGVLIIIVIWPLLKKIFML